MLLPFGLETCIFRYLQFQSKCRGSLFAQHQLWTSLELGPWLLVGPLRHWLARRPGQRLSAFSHFLFSLPLHHGAAARARAPSLCRCVSKVPSPELTDLGVCFPTTCSPLGGFPWRTDILNWHPGRSLPGHTSVCVGFTPLTTQLSGEKKSVFHCWHVFHCLLLSVPTSCFRTPFKDLQRDLLAG